MAYGSFEICAEFEFPAVHWLWNYRGAPEAPHAHSFRAKIALSVDGLDTDGIGFDFVLFGQMAGRIKSMFSGKELNTIAPFDKISPTAENLAVEIARLSKAELGKIDDIQIRPQVAWVEVWETEGMSAKFIPRTE